MCPVDERHPMIHKDKCKMQEEPHITTERHLHSTQAICWPTYFCQEHTHADRLSWWWWQMGFGLLQFLTHSPRSPLADSCCDNGMSFGLFVFCLSEKLNALQGSGGCGLITFTACTDYLSGPMALVLEEVLQEVRKWHDCSSGRFSRREGRQCFQQLHLGWIRNFGFGLFSKWLVLAIVDALLPSPKQCHVVEFQTSKITCHKFEPSSRATGSEYLETRPSHDFYG